MLKCPCCTMPQFVTKCPRAMRRHKERMRKAGINVPKEKPGRKPFGRGKMFKVSKPGAQKLEEMIQVRIVNLPPLYDAEDHDTDPETVSRVQSVMLGDLEDTINGYASTIAETQKEYDEWLLFTCPAIPDDASDELLMMIELYYGKRA